MTISLYLSGESFSPTFQLLPTFVSPVLVTMVRSDATDLNDPPIVFKRPCCFCFRAVLCEDIKGNNYDEQPEVLIKERSSLAENDLKKNSIHSIQ